MTYCDSFKILDRKVVGTTFCTEKPTVDDLVNCLLRTYHKTEFVCPTMCSIIRQNLYISCTDAKSLVYGPCDLFFTDENGCFRWKNAVLLFFTVGFEAHLVCICLPIFHKKVLYFVVKLDIV